MALGLQYHLGIGNLDLVQLGPGTELLRSVGGRARAYREAPSWYPRHGFLQRRALGAPAWTQGQVSLGGRRPPQRSPEEGSRLVRGDLARGARARAERHPPQERVRPLPRRLRLPVSSRRHGQEGDAELRHASGECGVGAAQGGGVREAADQGR